MISRRGLSPVIASVILSGMVLVIGAGVWSYSYGAASVMANDYSDMTLEMVHTIAERYCIEKVHYDSSTEEIHVWIYNYGKIAINVDVTLKIDGNAYSAVDNSLGSTELKQVTIDVSAESGLASYEDVIIEIVSERSNVEFMTYYVP